MAKDQFLFGHQEMVGVLQTAVIVMVTPIVFTLCQSVVRQSMEHAPGTLKSVLLPWLQHTAVVLTMRDKL